MKNGARVEVIKLAKYHPSTGTVTGTTQIKGRTYYSVEIDAGPGGTATLLFLRDELREESP